MIIRNDSKKSNNQRKNISGNIRSTIIKNFLMFLMNYTRTPQNMDGTLTLIFAKLETTRDITTKISALLQFRSKLILTKFEGCGSKIGPAMPI